MKRTGKKFQTAVSILLCMAILAGLLPAEVLAEGEHLRKVDFTSPDVITEMNEVTYKKDDTLRNPMD